MEFSHFKTTCRLNADVVVGRFPLHLTGRSDHYLPSFASLFSFSRLAVLWTLIRLRRGGGRRGWRSSQEGRSGESWICTFFLHVAARTRRSFLGCAPICLKKTELLRNRGKIKTCGLQKTERKPCQLPFFAPYWAISTTSADASRKNGRRGCFERCA